MTPENDRATISTLESRLRNRGENHLDFLRFLAATFVILSHSFALRGVHWEPLYELTGYQSFGRLGVGIFFVMSGLLITRSWLDRPEIAGFVVRRALRILPGLFCALLFCVFVVGPLATHLPLRIYFQSAPTYHYLGNILLFNLQYDLPGVFPDLPIGTLNGSLWTLPEEVKCYAAVLGLGLVGALSRRVFGWIAAVLIAGWLFEFLLAVNGDLHPAKVVAGPARECAMWFLLGALSYVYRDWICLNRWGALAAAAVYLATLSTDEGFPFNIGYLAAFPSITYLILYAVQVRAPILDRWSHWGDASYGMYIYAFPVQQLIVHWLGREIEAAPMFVLSMAATLSLAFASWHWIEKPLIALASRRRGTPPPDALARHALAV